ncbi:YkgJ family cysteine cluster protein [Oligoflexus tunisiensis]|uniref:YkgJ family cysteine cluster protein n=1 Tax=Oligoflexus tunisiensis TaxID=708132 RepID=UPI00114CC374|nr:YkgJ family cysteine cluster protein [Oligoflexus tunisiensis]
MKNDDSILQPIRLGTHLVPGIWRYMLPDDVFYFRVDPEVRSSCFNCPQVKAHGFHPSIRCCSYIPRVPNFLLGLALMDPGVRPVAQNFIATGYSIPEGSQVSPHHMEKSIGFLSGKLPQGSVICPLLDQNTKKCQIYAFRSGVCSTFFCRHDQGEAGAEFWESLTDLVTQVETALAQWALEQAGFDLGLYFERFETLAQDLEACSNPETGTWSDHARRQLFGVWYGREEELFQACAAQAIAHKKDLFEIAGRQKLRQTPGYDTTIRQRLGPLYSHSLIGEALPDGEPMPVRNLWYSTQLAHRNLQLHRIQASQDSGHEPHSNQQT